MNHATRASMMRFTAGAAVLLMGGAILSGCSSDPGDGKTTITLAGPNQWNSETTTFGQPWDDLVAKFEAANPDIELKTNVLPLSSWSDTLSTQLSAGTAPDLIFNQTPHTPDQVVPLDDYLNQPNPFVDGNTQWLDLFNPTYFGKDADVRNARGQYEAIPFNLVIAGIFYNKDAYEEAGITSPPQTFGEFIDNCTALTNAGYIPIDADKTLTVQNWTMDSIASMLMDKYADDLNVFDLEGDPGTATTVTIKSLAKGVLTGEIDATKTPEIAETLNLMKRFYDECATPNWAGVTTTGQDFLSGKTAMTWGTNFTTSVLTDVPFEWGTMGFPQVTVDDTDLSTDAPSSFGAAAGGTNYMIPATTTDAKLDAAVKFLQFVTSPENNQEWVKATGAIPSTLDTAPAPGLEGLVEGSWADVPRIRNVSHMAPQAMDGNNDYTGYLIGSKSLDDTLATMQQNYEEWAKEQAANGQWTEDWAQAN